MSQVYLVMEVERYEGESVAAVFTGLHKAKEYAEALMKECGGKPTQDGSYGLRWSAAYNGWGTFLYIDNRTLNI